MDIQKIYVKTFFCKSIKASLNFVPQIFGLQIGFNLFFSDISKRAMFFIISQPPQPRGL